MFADMVGSTALSGTVDPELLGSLIRRYQGAVAGAMAVQDVVAKDDVAPALAARPVDEKDRYSDADEAGLELCGGIYSGDGGSFRGKVYDELVRDITGVSLYEQWIPPEAVRKMATAFEACDLEAAAEPGIPAGVVVDLARFFRICADRNLGLIGWW